MRVLLLAAALASTAGLAGCLSAPEPETVAWSGPPIAFAVERAADGTAYVVERVDDGPWLGATLLYAFGSPLAPRHPVGMTPPGAEMRWGDFSVVEEADAVWVAGPARALYLFDAEGEPVGGTWRTVS